MKVNIFSIILMVLMVLLASCKVKDDPTSNSIPITTNADCSSQTLVGKYFQIYVQISSIDKETDNRDIAAMLKQFSVSAIRFPPSTWEEIICMKNQYVEETTTNYISDNYVIMASENEIFIVDEFLVETINCFRSYFETNDTDCIYRVGDFIGNISTKFIVRMNDYEYQKDR